MMGQKFNSFVSFVPFLKVVDTVLLLNQESKSKEKSNDKSE